MNDFIVYVLACIGVHRIWNFEDIFQPLRRRLLVPHNRRVEAGKWSPLKALLCHACNAFWIALGIAASILFAPFPLVLLAEKSFAGYAVVRFALWSYAAIPPVFKILSKTRAEPSMAAKTTPTPAAAESPDYQALPAYKTPPYVLAMPPAEAAKLAHKPATEQKAIATTEVKDCGCNAKKKALVTEQSRAKEFERRVVLLTSLASFHPSYSLVSVIFDQARMLAMNAKWLVQIWVHEGTDLKDLPPLPENVEVRTIVPRVAWKLDVVDQADRQRLASTVRGHLLQLGNATIISHDMIFISHYLTFAAAIHDIADTKAFTWLHVCHSAAEKNPLMPGNDRKYRYSLPDGHYLLCLNPAERDHLASHYHTSVERVFVAPNARDITAFGDFHCRAATLTQKHRLAEADVVQVYPVSSTRLAPKGVDVVVDVLARIATKHGKTVRLVLPNAHANAQAEKDTLAKFRERAVGRGLPSDALVITSEEFPDSSADGLPAAAVKDLFTVSNLFIFPSLSELSSLVMREAAISGCLMVSNISLHTTPVDLALPGLSFPFGSLRSGASRANLDEVAAKVVEALDSNPMNTTKRFSLRRYCYRVVGEELRAIIESAKPV